MVAMSVANIVLTYQLNNESDRQRQELTTVVQQSEKISREIEKLNDVYININSDTYTEKQRIQCRQNEVSRSMERSFRSVVTGYDLSVQSCGKAEDHPAYGITASGESLVGHNLYSARAIAVDPTVIPLGSKVRIIFDNPDVKQYNGIYTAIDTGGAIKGTRIDLFFGDTGSDNISEEALTFGVQDATVYILD